MFYSHILGSRASSSLYVLVQMFYREEKWKGSFLGWSFWVRHVGTRDFYPALAALVSPVQFFFFFFTVHFFNFCVPLTQQPGQAVVPGRLYLYVCLRCKLSTDKLTQAGCYLLFSLLLDFFPACVCWLKQRRHQCLGVVKIIRYTIGLEQIFIVIYLICMFPKVDCDGWECFCNHLLSTVQWNLNKK